MSSLTADIFILGAAKAGTTSLHDLLNAHPKIKMSVLKEPMFFSRDDYFERGVDWYSKTFYSEEEGEFLSGEASPHYLYWAEKVASRMHDIAGQKELKFIVILRDPVYRAYSWYWNMIKEGEENLPFDEAIANENERLIREETKLRKNGSMIYGYKKGSMYAQQINEFLRYFPKRNFFFLLQEDLHSDAAGRIRRLFDFLDVSYEAYEPNSARKNPASMPRSRALQDLLRNPSAIKDRVKAAIPFRVRQAIKKALLRANSAPFVYPELNANSEAKLRMYFADEVRELQGIVERDLSHWLPRTDERPTL